MSDYTRCVIHYNFALIFIIFAACHQFVLQIACLCLSCFTRIQLLIQNMFTLVNHRSINYVPFFIVNSCDFLLWKAFRLELYRILTVNYIIIWTILVLQRIWWLQVQRGKCTECMIYWWFMGTIWTIIKLQTKIYSSPVCLSIWTLLLLVVYFLQLHCHFM